MQITAHIQSRLIHFKKQILNIVAAEIISIVVVCRIFDISRTTFYKYRKQKEIGQLGINSCAPHNHGRAKEQEIIDIVLNAKAMYPKYGKKRLSNILRSWGIRISPNTVQNILKQHNLELNPFKKKQSLGKLFEAIAPNMIWSIDICYLYTKKKDGFNLYLISILDDHSRKIVSSGLFIHQTLIEVIKVLKEAVLNYGVPQVLVCDNGSQFTCSEFRRVCKAIELKIDYAPKNYPQYKGKLERFFRTTREEKTRADTTQIAYINHSKWITEYNIQRIHSSVTDEHDQAYPPEYRFSWKPSAACPLKSDLKIDDVFTVQVLCKNSRSREVKANKTISYLKQKYHFPTLNKGDIVQIKEDSECIKFFYLEGMIHCVTKPPIQRGACTRKVKRNGTVKFKKALFVVDLPKDTQVLIVEEGKHFVFYFNNRKLFKVEKQEFC